MTASAPPPTLTIRVPFAIRKRGGRKRIICPDGTTPILALPQPNTTLIKALARAFRWRNMLESGAYATIDELGKAEKINPSYLSRTLRLTLLSPQIVEEILDGTCDDPDALMKSAIAKPWKEQQTNR